MKNTKRYLVCSDLHGQYDLWQQIKNYLQEDDVLIFLGDAIDRGSSGIKIAQEMFEDERVIYLLGNHEDMMLDWWLSRGEREEYDCLHHWYANGAAPTYSAFMELDANAQRKFIENLIKCEWEMEVEVEDEEKGDYKIYLNHAGSTPHCAVHNRGTCLWRRDHFRHKWPQNNNDVVIHGHTPHYFMVNQYGIAFEQDDIVYCNGHKICLDWACFATKQIPLYNLNEMKLETLFIEENK